MGCPGLKSSYPEKGLLGSLIYNFRREKKNQMNENCHKWKKQYSYPVPVNKRYCSEIINNNA